MSLESANDLETRLSYMNDLRSLFCPRHRKTEKAWRYLGCKANETGDECLSFSGQIASYDTAIEEPPQFKHDHTHTHTHGTRVSPALYSGALSARMPLQRMPSSGLPWSSPFRQTAGLFVACVRSPTTTNTFRVAGLERATK